MTTIGWLQILVYVLIVLVLTRPLGNYLFRVFEGQRRLGPAERLLARLAGVRLERDQTWSEYALALLAFSAVSLLATYALQRLQHLLPFNPQGFGAVEPTLAFNTAASFATNSNWQSYGGETTMSYLTQMAGLAWHNFTSAAAGLAVALALARGLTRRRGPDGKKTLGNFWADLLRGTLYVFLPLSLVLALALVTGGVIQNLSPYLEVQTLEGSRQTLAMGPVASQVAIKQLGSNGGGFFNANSAHPFENPTPLVNFLECLSILCLPAAQVYLYGKMAGDTRQGWVLVAAMAFLLLAGFAVCYRAESQPSAALAGQPVAPASGNLEGKEVRFGVAGSVLWAVATTATANGSVNSMHDSYSPLGGLVPLVNIQLGEVVFGGVGAGLYGILVFVLLAVFLSGLMVGRTPEYLGKKIESREMKLVLLYLLIFPPLVLGLSAWSAANPYGRSVLGNAGPHGLSEILYAFSSTAGNNGSAFAGLNANTPWWNVSLGLAMLAGRFLMIVPVLALAGSMVGKKTSPPGPGTFPTHGLLFAALLVAVIVIVGALTFFPALSLGPVIEHFLAARGRAF